MIYLGDGAGDYCPSLRLKAEDYMMPRKNFPVWELICENRDIVKAEIHEWSDGDEFARILLQLIHEISREDHNDNDDDDDDENISIKDVDCGTTSRLFTVECNNFSTSAMPVHEALPQTLPVAVPVRF